MGCDGAVQVLMVGDQVFQSTHPSGVRLDPCAHQMPQRGISIHAPQWGATFSIGTDTAASYFNPRTPVGCDGPLARTYSGVSSFQSTHPSGVRLDIFSATSKHQKISIHAPQWGATMLKIPYSVVLSVFQSTHPSGVRPEITDESIGVIPISIHAPQWGATLRY